MKKIISILGATGSIGIHSLRIFNKNKKLFNFYIFMADKNYSLICKQIIKYKPKIYIINNIDILKKVKKRFKKNKTKIFSTRYLQEKNIKKSDITIAAIPGIAGLKPTIELVKKSKRILIANKESIICGWNLLNKELKKFNTKFIPVDSEHFSIWFALQNKYKSQEIKNIYITASGGPFKNKPLNEFKNISIKDALKHPNWKMGKKITIDSATMVNKVFELIEAKNIFNIPYNKLSILIHPSSYVHAIIKFRNGLSKIILHDTDMKIPIFNSLNYPKLKEYKDKPIDIVKLNQLELSKVNLKRFSSVKILKYLPKNSSLFETILVSSNDKLVNLFLKKQINFIDIPKRLLNIVRSRKFRKFKGLKPKKIDDIIKLNSYVRSVIN